jgi:hypothetical protein
MFLLSLTACLSRPCPYMLDGHWWSPVLVEMVMSLELLSAGLTHITVMCNYLWFVCYIPSSEYRCFLETAEISVYFYAVYRIIF